MTIYRSPGQRIKPNTILGRGSGSGLSPAQSISISELATAIANNGALPLPSSGSGLISSVDSNFTVTGGGQLQLHTAADGNLLANISGSTAEPSANDLSAIIDHTLGSTEGQIIQRGASAWQVLAPGTNGQVLTSGGAGALNSWATGGGGGGTTISNGGAWSGASAYTVGQVVQYNGASYLCYSGVSAPAGSTAPFNSGDELGMTLSTANYANDTATTTSRTGAYANSSGNGKTTGLWYFEFKCTNLFDNNTSVGIATTGVLNGSGTIVGTYMVGTALGTVTGNGAGSGSGSFAGLTNGARGGVAVNFTTGKFWITADVTAGSINWNGSTSNSPGAGTGGVAIGTFGTAFEVFIDFGTVSASQVCTLFTTTGAFSIAAVPSGFSAWGAPATNNLSPDQDDAHWTAQGNNQLPQGRLSLSSSAAVQTADVSGGSSIYYLPYVGIYAPLGMIIPTAGLTLALDSNSGHTGYHQSGKIFDFFIYNDGGTLRLVSGPAWTSSTARSQAIDQTTVPGLWTNTASMTAKFDTSSSTKTVPAGNGVYVGSMYASANGQCTCQFNPAAASGGCNTIVGLYNAYNKVPAVATSADSTSTWTYSSATWRGQNASSSNCISWLDGLGDICIIGNNNMLLAATAGTSTASCGINLDATTGTPGAVIMQNNGAASAATAAGAKYIGEQLGFHFMQAMENAAGGLADTFFGSPYSTLFWFGKK